MFWYGRLATAAAMNAKRVVLDVVRCVYIVCCLWFAGLVRQIMPIKRWENKLASLHEVAPKSGFRDPTPTVSHFWNSASKLDCAYVQEQKKNACPTERVFKGCALPNWITSGAAPAPHSTDPRPEPIEIRPQRSKVFRASHIDPGSICIIEPIDFYKPDKWLPVSQWPGIGWKLSSPAWRVTILKHSQDAGTAFAYTPPQVATYSICYILLKYLH